MPRPQRAKIISAHAQAKRVPLSQKTTNSRQQEAQSAEFSSDSDKTVRRKKGYVPKPRADGVVVEMSGGLGIKDDNAQKTSEKPTTGQARFIANSRETPAPVPVSHVPSRTPIIAKPSKPTKEPSRSQPASKTATRKPLVSTTSSTQPAPNTTVREPSTNIVERVTDSFPSLQPQPQISAPPSALKPQGTPSFLSISNFKKRPRQPSLLRMVQKSLAGETAGDSEDDASSVLTLGDDTLDDTLEGLGGIAAEIEDTDVLVQSSGSRKRKRSEIGDGRDAEGYVSSPAPTPPKQARHSVTYDGPQSVNGIDVVASSLPTHEHGDSSISHPHRRRRTTTNAAVTPPPRKGNREQSRGDQQHHLEEASATSPISSDTPPASSSPSQLESPKTKRLQRKNKASKPSPLKSATLQSLLPRRRVQLPARVDRTDEFEILDSSDEAIGTRVNSGDLDDEDVDVLTRPSTRRPRGALAKVTPKGKAKSKLETKRKQTATTAVFKPKPGRKGIGKSKKPLTDASVTSPAQSRRTHVSKTYGKRRGEDKENSDSLGPIELDLDDENDEVEGFKLRSKKSKVNSGKSAELSTAAKTFKEVDEWELSFESCDVGGGGSSPWR